MWDFTFRRTLLANRQIIWYSNRKSFQSNNNRNRIESNKNKHADYGYLKLDSRVSFRQWKLAVFEISLPAYQISNVLNFTPLPAACQTAAHSTPAYEQKKKKLLKYLIMFFPKSLHRVREDQRCLLTLHANNLIDSFIPKPAMTCG